MTLKLLKVGHCFHPERMVIKGGSWKSKAFPAIVGLIKHPNKGYILFDTGYSHHFHHATQPFPERFYRWTTPVCLHESESLIFQLEKLNIAAEDIRHIFISHFHADHIAGLKDFPNATFICSKVALEKMRKSSRWGNLIHGCLPSLLPQDFTERVCFIEECKKVQLLSSISPFQYGFDLFQDGAMLAIELPGHASGHFGLMTYANKASCFLIGDACWDVKTITQHRNPHPISHIILSDTKEYYETLDKLARLHTQNAELRLLPSHCTQSYEDFCAQEG